MEFDHDPDGFFEDDPFQNAADEIFAESKEEGYEEGHEDGERSIDPLVAGAFFSMGAGAAEELDERKLADKVLNGKSKTEPEIEKVPLRERHGEKAKRKHKVEPFYRWADQVCKGQRSIESPINLNEEEQAAVRKKELDDIKAIDKLMGY